MFKWAGSEKHISFSFKMAFKLFSLVHWIHILLWGCTAVFDCVHSMSQPESSNSYNLMQGSSPLDMQQIFVFSTSNKNWRLYDWKKITTLVQCGYHDEELVNYAHSNNVSVSYIANIDVNWLTNASHRSAWVKDVVNYMQSHKLDGVNVDFEDAINSTEIDRQKGLTLLLQELSESLKAVQPQAQITIDFAWSPECIDSRCYDYASLAAIADFVFIMAYDERSQIFGPCVAWANSPVNQTLAGLSLFSKSGIPPSKMVLGVPWYGYDYPCISYDEKQGVCGIKSIPFRGVPCSDAAGRQFGYSFMMEVVNMSFTGRLWDDVAQSPYATYKDRGSGSIHQVWYDDTTSLQIKYNIAHQLGLLGVGMWEADSLDYTDTPDKRFYVREMWNALPNKRR